MRSYDQEIMVANYIKLFFILAKFGDLVGKAKCSTTERRARPEPHSVEQCKLCLCVPISEKNVEYVCLYTTKERLSLGRRKRSKRMEVKDEKAL